MDEAELQNWGRDEVQAELDRIWIGLKQGMEKDMTKRGVTELWDMHARCLNVLVKYAQGDAERLQQHRAARSTKRGRGAEHSASGEDGDTEAAVPAGGGAEAEAAEAEAGGADSG